MAGRGLHLALTDEELNALCALRSVEDQISHIGSDIETTKFGTPDACETDKSWAYIHATLTGTDPDGPLEIPSEPAPRTSDSFLARLFGRSTPSPVAPGGAERYAIMGQRALLSTDDYYVGLVPKEEVAAVASALGLIAAQELGRRLAEVHRRFGASGDPGEAVEYALGWYPNLVVFYREAAEHGKHVIFTVDF